MPDPLCSQPFCVTEANPPSSAALLWSSIIPWPPLTLQGAHCVLITEWSSRHWPPMAFKCPPVQPYSMPSCLSLGGHFASNGGEAAEASRIMVIYNIAYFILLYCQAIHSKAIHMSVHLWTLNRISILLYTAELLFFQNEIINASQSFVTNVITGSKL